MRTAIEMIRGERRRQRQKGFTAEHDDEHGDGSLLHAAMLLLVDEAGQQLANVDPPAMDGPWPDQLLLRVREKYAGDEIQRLVIAAAVLVAEIERLERKRVAEGLAAGTIPLCPRCKTRPLDPKWGLCVPCFTSNA